MQINDDPGEPVTLWQKLRALRWDLGDLFLVGGTLWVFWWLFFGHPPRVYASPVQEITLWQYEEASGKLVFATRPEALGMEIRNFIQTRDGQLIPWWGQSGDGKPSEVSADTLPREGGLIVQYACAYTRPSIHIPSTVDKCFVWKVPFAWTEEASPRLEIPSGPVTSRFISSLRKLEPHEYPTLLQ